MVSKRSISSTMSPGFACFLNAERRAFLGRNWLRRSFGCRVLVLEHGADLVTQLRRVLMAMYRRRVENSKAQNVVFRAGNND